MNVIEQLRKEEADRLLAQRKIPEFRPGDTVRVNVRIKEASASASRPMRASASPAPARASTRTSPSARSPSAKAWNVCSRSCRR